MGGLADFSPHGLGSDRVYLLHHDEPLRLMLGADGDMQEVAAVGLGRAHKGGTSAVATATPTSDTLRRLETAA